MIYFEAPQEITTWKKSVFLAGTITGAENWQRELTESLEDTDLTILNPRRENFPKDNPNAAKEQITWEYNALKSCSLVSFYFPKDGLSPITLYELGKCSAAGSLMIVAVEPGFWREKDVHIQTKLIRPEIVIGNSLKYLEYELKILSRVRRVWT